MGDFGGLFGCTQDEIDKAYREGVEQAKSEGILSGILDGMVSLIAGPFLDEAAEARERGREDYTTGKTK